MKTQITCYDRYSYMPRSRMPALLINVSYIYEQRRHSGTWRHVNFHATVQINQPYIVWTYLKISDMLHGIIKSCKLSILKRVRLEIPLGEMSDNVNANDISPRLKRVSLFTALNCGTPTNLVYRS